MVTPNVDHVVMYQSHEGLRRAYADAALVTADGMPVVFAARWLGRTLPERVSGSDLVPALFSAVEQRSRLRVYLLGGMPGVAERAAKRIRSTWPGVEVVGTASPPFGFEHDAEYNAELLTELKLLRPDVLVVGLGAPKQKLWVWQHRHELGARAALCVGAAIDFLAGEKRRAPRWMRCCG